MLCPFLWSKFTILPDLTFHPFPFSKDIPVLADTYPFNSIPIPYRKRDSDLLNRKQLDAI